LLELLQQVSQQVVSWAGAARCFDLPITLASTGRPRSEHALIVAVPQDHDQDAGYRVIMSSICISISMRVREQSPLRLFGPYPVISTATSRPISDGSPGKIDDAVA
jgi:hypothetical protein